jgi:hypothetical protein
VKSATRRTRREGGQLMSSSTLATIGYVVLLIILLGFAAIVLIKILNGTIPLKGLIAEIDGDKASLSRFQFLIFTFLVAGLFLMLTIESGGFVEIPDTVLGLLGISGGSYVVSKALSSQQSQKKDQAEAQAEIAKTQAAKGA